MKLPSLRNVPEAWCWALSTWLIARIVLSGMGLLLTAVNLVPLNSAYGDLYFGIEPLREGWAGALLGVWQRWDAVYYLHIAQAGYTEASLTAFFPLYPALGSLVSRLIGGNTLLALLIVSNFATVAAFAFLYDVTAEITSSRAARLAVLALAVFPTALYLYAPYAESLALLLVLYAYKSARHQRWWLAGLAGVGAGLTQPAVVPLTILLGGTVWRTARAQHQPLTLNSVVAASGPLLGLGLFLGWRTLNGLPSYTEVQSTWGWHIQWPWQALLSVPQMFTAGTIWIGGWISLIQLMLAFAAVLFSLKHLPVELMLFQVAALAFLLITSRAASPLDSLSRHSLMIFPIYIMLSQRLMRSKTTVLLAMSTMLMLYLTAEYIRWR